MQTTENFPSYASNPSLSSDSLGEQKKLFKKRIHQQFGKSDTRSPGQAKLPDVAMVQFWSVPPLTVMPAKRSSEMDLDFLT